MVIHGKFVHFTFHLWRRNGGLLAKKMGTFSKMSKNMDIKKNRKTKIKKRREKIKHENAQKKSDRRYSHTAIFGWASIFRPENLKKKKPQECAWKCILKLSRILADIYRLQRCASGIPQFKSEYGVWFR